MLFSGAAPFYIHTNSEQVFQSFHIFANTCYLSFLVLFYFVSSHPSGYRMKELDSF